MSEPPEEAELRALLEAIDRERPRVVVRFIDETRIVPQGESGYTVGPVTSITLTASHRGEASQTTIQGLSLQRAKRIIAEYPVEALYRSDNITA